MIRKTCRLLSPVAEVVRRILRRPPPPLSSHFSTSVERDKDFNDDSFVLSLKGVSIRPFAREIMRSGVRFGEPPDVVVKDVDWVVRANEHWILLGPNGAGKTSLAKAIKGDAWIKSGSISRKRLGNLGVKGREMNLREDIGIVSFEEQCRAHRRQRTEMESRVFAAQGGHVRGPTAVEIIFGRDENIMNTFLRLHQEARKEDEDGVSTITSEEGGELQRLRVLFTKLRLFSLGEKPYTALSSGELRRMLIGAALAKQPKILILDEPFDGLDVEMRDTIASQLRESLGTASEQEIAPTQLIVITHRAEEIPTSLATHVALLADGRMVEQGRVDDMGDALQKYASSMAFVQPEGTAKGLDQLDTKKNRKVLIDAKNLSVQYGGTPVLRNVTFTIREGQHLHISGPNGCGKSTLLRLINADHPQVCIPPGFPPRFSLSISGSLAHKSVACSVYVFVANQCLSLNMSIHDGRYMQMT